MKTIFDHIEQVKGKPHYVRKRVAFTAAACGSALIALVWLVGNVSRGTFAIQGTSFADSRGTASVVATDSDSDSNSDSNRVSDSLAGVASAVPAKDAPAHIEIVDATSSPSVKKQTEQTIIPF